VINFRYHVVSLTAVFLALAIGLVLGTAALNGPLSDALNDQVKALGKDNKQLRERVSLLEDDVNKQEQFAAQIAPLALAQKLAGRRVTIVSVTSGGDYVQGIADLLTTAGAKITGEVHIKDDFTNPAKSVDMLDLADKADPASIPVTTLPTNSDGVETSSALLAAVLTDRTPAVPEADRNAVLAAYTQASYISIDDKHKVTGPAEAIVLVAGGPYVDRDASAKNQAVVTVVTQLDKASPLVVAGNSPAGDGNVVAEVRGDPTLSKTISTVDNASTEQGVVSTALALVEQLAGKAGQYGTSNGVLVPKPE
jgi:hypothetical protein